MFEGMSDFNTTMFLLMAISGIFVFLKDSIVKFVKAIADLFIYKLNIAYSDYDYHLFNRWLAKNEDKLFLNRSFRPARWEGEEAHPGYGFSFLKLPGFPLTYIYRYKDESKTAVYEQTDCIHMSFFTLRKNRVKEFMELVKNESKTKEITLYTSEKDGCWLYSGEVRKVLPPTDAVSLSVVSTVETFLKSEKWQGLPHKLSIMLHGEPGTGKTCLIAYLAHRFKLPVYSLGPAANFQQAIRGINNLPAIVAVEDIDLSIYGVKRTNLENGEPKPSIPLPLHKKKLEIPKSKTDHMDEMEEKFGSLALHEILNSLDGLRAVDGMIFVFTTNKIDALDPALLRAGRVDLTFEMKRMTVQEQYEYIQNFGPDKLGTGISLIEPLPVCQLQKILLESRNQYLENVKNGKQCSPNFEDHESRVHRVGKTIAK